MNLDKIGDNVFSSLKKVTPTLFGCAVITEAILLGLVTCLQMLHLDTLNEIILSWMGATPIASIAVIIFISLLWIINDISAYKELVDIPRDELEQISKEYYRSLDLLANFVMRDSL